MRASNANFDAQRVHESKKPVYLLVVKNVKVDPPVVLLRYATKTITGDAALPYLSLPRVASQMITPEEGRISVGSISMSILDRDLDLSAFLVGNSLKGTRGELYMGFRDIPTSDFLQMFTGTIEDVSMSSDFLSYSVQLRDVSFFPSKATLFALPTSKLSAEIDDVVTTIPVEAASIASFPVPGVYPGLNHYVAIEKEIMKYTAVDSVGGSLTVVRAQKGTVALAHAINKKVEELVVIGDFAAGINPVTVFLHILFSSGTPYANHATYDTFPAHWGMNIDPALIDVDRFEFQRDLNVPIVLVEYQLRGSEKAQMFIATEFFKMLGAYPLIAGDGRLGIKFFDRPTPEPDIPHINGDNTVELQTMDLNLDRTYNHLGFDYDWDPIDNEFQTRAVIKDQESIDIHGEQTIRIYQSKGFRSERQASVWLSDRAGFILFRYGSPPPIFKLKCFFSQVLLEGGDQVFFSHPLPPNLYFGGRGLRFARMELINRRIDMDRSHVELELQFVTAHQNFAFWGPEGDADDAYYDAHLYPSQLPDFSGATIDQKTLYGWATDADGMNSLPAGADASNPATVGGTIQGKHLG